eukprot:GFUD01071098.1.p1 GENE.GFUD01071098.1~~GFUD01071098.1.p1  ORF type:complete len:136 (-),score=27.42 GFUD01071098.1:28-435(-)
MVDLYTVSLGCVSGFHLLFGLGNLFKFPPYDPANFLVSGKPGTGATEIEKLLEFVFGLWYTGSITGVLLAFFYGSSDCLRGSLVCPLFYHATVSIAALIFFDKYKICNKKKASGTVVGLFHAVMASMFGYVFYMS